MKKSIPTSDDVLNNNCHIRFFKHFLHSCPSSLSEHDCNRVTLAFFAICGIDILDGLETLPPPFRKEIIDWIYHLQVLPLDNEEQDKDRICGFQGGSTNILVNAAETLKAAHLANTYTGLSSLIILGDDLRRVNKRAILEGVGKLQQPDGSFCGTPGSEADMRFVYCAACICYILNDFSTIDVHKMVSFILRSMRYDGALGQGPGMESHGGSTFCGVAALALSSSLDVLSTNQLERLKRWCVLRQKEGFSGRPYKPDDTCYSFWVVGTLALLGGVSWVQSEENRSFLMTTQDPRGGFSKYPDSISDPLHTFFGLAGLSLLNEKSLQSVEPLLVITQRAHQWLKTLQESW